MGKIVGAIINRPYLPNMHTPYVELLKYGKITDEAINKISVHYKNVNVDKCVIMPNHIHLILVIHNCDDSGRLIIAPTNVSTIVQQFKRYVSKKAGISLWQKSFHDHIVRNEFDYLRIWQYVDENPLRWHNDCYYTGSSDFIENENRWKTTMDYKSVMQVDENIIIKDLQHFDLAQTLDCGQAFRWVPVGARKFHGIAHGRYLEVEFTDGNLILKSTTMQEFNDIWKSYLDLERGYGELREFLKQHGTPSEKSAMEKALAFSPGLRLMRQDTWEILVSFILSQNSNIPRIKKMIELLCENFGQPIGDQNGYAFPTPQTLASLTEHDLAVIRSGYRAAYIIDAARRVASGEFDPSHLSNCPTEDVRAALLQIHGVGPKVADCVLLFGFGRIECFPLDVWMKRAMAEFYPAGFPVELQEYAGIAQQFLFHYARVHGL